MIYWLHQFDARLQFIRTFDNVSTSINLYKVALQIGSGKGVEILIHLIATKIELLLHWDTVFTHSV